MTFSGDYLRLYACCIPVKGAARSILCDTQRDKYHFIPNDFYDFLLHCEQQMIKKIIDDNSEENQPILLEYINFLIDNELAFFTNSPELFPAIEENFETPELIGNAIIDVDDNSSYDINKAVKELDRMSCKSLQFRFFGNISKEMVDQSLKMLSNSSFHTVEIVVSLSGSLSKTDVETIITGERRLSAIYAFGSPIDMVVDINSNVMKKIFYINQQMNGPVDCGCISPTYFSTNLHHIIESKSWNNCLNKKICIDTNGFIKNCPSMSESFGHIDNTSLLATSKLKQFQMLWAINKDLIEVCKDCEFRYICSDCRAYTVNGNFTKPQKCNYDPYTAKWS